MMNLCSSVPDFAKPYVIHEESLVADELFGEISHVTRLCLNLKLMFIYGSLSRPPEAHYEAGFCTRHNDMEQISNIIHNSSGLHCFTCSFNKWNHALKCNCIVGVVVTWYTLASRYAHRERELRLDSFQQILEYKFDKRWLEMLLVRSGLVFLLCKLTRLGFFFCLSRECASEVGMICVIDPPTLCCVVAAMLLMNFRGLRVIAPHIDGLFDGLYPNPMATKILQSVLKFLYPVNHSLVVEFKRMDKLSPLLIVDGKWLEFWIKDIRSFLKTSKGSSAKLLLHVAKKLLPLEDPHTFGELLCEFLISKSIKAEFHELSSLLQLLGNFQEVLCDDLVCFWSVKDEFQRPKGQFKTMEIALDHCYFVLVCFSPATLLHNPCDHCVGSAYSQDVMFYANGNGEFDSQWMALDIGSQVLIIGQSYAYECSGKIIKAHSGWFGSLLGFFYGSFTRPPEAEAPLSSMAESTFVQQPYLVVCLLDLVDDSR